METPASSSAPSPATSADPREILQKMLDGLGLHTKVEQHTIDGATLLHIATVEPGRLIGKGGLTLSQLQFLVNRILQRASPDAPRVIVDCERYRERQRDDILKKVAEAADKVRRWGDPVQLEPMNSFDRRIVHRAFTDDPEIETYSSDEEWEGGRKRITIQLRQSQPSA